METIYAPNFGVESKIKRMKIEAANNKRVHKILDHAIVLFLCYTFYNLIQWCAR